MKIELLCENTVKLLLEAEDMDRYGLTFEEIDYNQPSTQRAFRDMMSKVRRDVGFSSDGCRLLVEARACPDGGCILTVTKQPLSRRGRDSRREFTRVSRIEEEGEEEEARIFRFEAVDHLLDASLLLRDIPGMRSARLYHMEEAYYLLAELDQQQDYQLALTVLREFGCECPAGLLAPLEERGSQLEGYAVPVNQPQH
ncbi:MAG: adaptor protein MecA [Clostridiales bacterium]|nr:adaptor protein MecA [Clostridiales bacterium]